MWDSAPKYRLYCVIKGNISCSNSKRELVFNIKVGKQTPKHSENPHAGTDSMQVWMGAGTARGKVDRGAGRQNGGVWRVFTTGAYCPWQSRTETLSSVISSACHYTPLLSLSSPRRHCGGSGQLSCPTCNIWKVIFGSWGFAFFSSFSLGLKKSSVRIKEALI